MRIILDECVDPRLKAAFVGHEVRTVAEMGWKGYKNGRLLNLCDGRFEVFVTLDQNLEFQQNLKRRKIAFLVMVVPDNKLSSYRPIFDQLREAVESISPSQVMRVPRDEPGRV